MYMSDIFSVRFDRCPANETYVTCKVGCPTNYCPKDVSRAIVACSPPYPCPSGCVCESDYLRLSTECDRCILARECREFPLFYICIT